MLSETQVRQYSEYLLFRSFYTGFEPDANEISSLKPLRTLEQLVDFLRERLAALESPGILLSSGMDSASLLAYMPKGTVAYTIIHEGDDRSEVELAARYAKWHGVEHKVVTITPEAYMAVLPKLMINKKMPPSPAEPIVYLAALQAKRDGCLDLVTGDGAETKCGGFLHFRGRHPMDGYIASLAKRYHSPHNVLRKSSDCRHVFENYLSTERGWARLRTVVDSRSFLREVGVERFAFENAVTLAGCRHVAPFNEISYDFDDEVNKKKPKYLVSDVFESIYGEEPPVKLGMHKPPALLELFTPKTPIFRSVDFRKLKYPRRFLIYSLDLYHYLVETGEL